MEKQIYLIRGEGKESYPAFKSRIFSLLNEIKEEKSPGALWVTLTETPPPAFSIIPFKKKKIAAISVTGSGSLPVGDLIRESGFTGAYTVNTAQPVKYVKNWDDGTPTPGICLLTLFSQKKNIDRTTFLDRWHNSHTPLSLRLHPLWHYDRNVVEEKLTGDSHDWHGIVEEHFRTRKELLHPVRFFGNHPVKMFWHMWEVYADTKSFLDYRTIEPYLTREYRIKG